MWCEACLAGLPARDKKHTNKAGCLYVAKEKKMKWIVRLVIVFCLAAWAVFLAGCVDETPEGQVYLCTFRDAADGRDLFEVERCGPEDDPMAPAWELAEEYTSSGAPRAVTIDCRGTHRACGL